MKNFYKETEQGYLINIKVIPNSSKTIISGTEILPLTDEMFLKIKISSPATENKANEELIKFLSKIFKIPKSSMEVVKGLKSKEKKIFIKMKNDIIPDVIKKYNCPTV